MQLTSLLPFSRQAHEAWDTADCAADEVFLSQPSLLQGVQKSGHHGMVPQMSLC